MISQILLIFCFAQRVDPVRHQFADAVRSHFMDRLDPRFFQHLTTLIHSVKHKGKIHHFKTLVVIGIPTQPVLIIV